ncbi:tetratricopeptide repeat protein [Streptococcus sp. NLN76]|uniref:tetratricopeptide repeat protein n=1 Tax=Streptococcus sp. NLN76 TaxID=2822800 RepID=UPI0018AC08D5|nr:tetratricopeptide repeat protein [Streptococcus sp. NLN76]MBF8970964.1 tetratricopeptide repeat protein [Streptococcus sp. NLN76]
MNPSQILLEALENQNLEAAQAAFDLLLQESSPEQQFEMALYLEEMGFYDQAQLLYEKVKEAYPEAFLSLAQMASQEGRTEEAFAYLEEIPKTSDWYLASLLVKADLYQAEGLTDVAREKLMEAQELSDDPIIVFGIAELEFELGNYRAAIQAYASLDNREIYALTGISTYQRIALSYASLGKMEAAIEFLEKAIELEYDDKSVHELALLLLETGRAQRALDYFRQLEALSPDMLGFEWGYARALKEEHQLEEALRVAKAGLAKNPFDDHLLLLASQLSYELHETQEAKAYLLEAKEVAEDLEEIYLRLSNLYLEEEAYADLVAQIPADVDSVLTKWNLAKALLALEEDERALAIYQDLAGDLKANPEFLEEYAYILRQMGQTVEAAQAAKAVLDLVPDHADMQEFLNGLDA